MASQGPLAWGRVAAVWQGTWREGQLILRKVRRPSLGPADAKGSELSWGVGVCVCVSRPGRSLLLSWNAAFSAVLPMVTGLLSTRPRV